jgi:hypothetical protein
MDSATLARRWSDFRRWRRGRPFWSGLLLMLSGVELWLSSNMDLGALEVHLGYEGFLSYVLPAVMLLCGVFVWLSPNQRLFYGIVGGLTAIYSLIGLNLGGWFVGMLIGVIGGGLAFAWTPVSTVEQPATGEPPSPDDEPTTYAGTAIRTAAPRHGRDDDEEEPPASSGGSAGPSGGGFAGGSAGRLLAIVLPVLLLAGGLAIAAAPPSEAAMTAPCTNVAAAVPAAAAPTATPGPTRPPTLLELWIEFWERIFGKTAPKPTAFPSTAPPTVAPTASPSPTCEPTAPGTTGPGPATGTPTAPGTGGPGTGDPAAPAASASPTAAPARQLAAAAGQPVVSDHPAHVTTSLLILNGFAFDGVVDLPTTGGGTIRALQFSIARASNADFRLVVERGGERLEISSDPLIVSGDVKLYTSRFSGSFLGIPLTFTPDFPPPLTLPDMIFTEVSLELVFLDCDTLDGPSLLIA